MFIFGFGYTGRALAKQLLVDGWSVFGTTRNPEEMEELRKFGITPVLWAGDDISDTFSLCTHILISTAPTAKGDPVLHEFSHQIGRLQNLRWLGYLSTTGVYGDRQGGWVDENSVLTPATKRGKLRVEAEISWKKISNIPLHIFRLAGIYGPGRGPFSKVKNGTARRIIKKNQVFSRIHVDDIVRVLCASIERPRSGAIYNVCDDNAAPPQDVIGYAAELLGQPLPPELDYEAADMTPMARSFYAESKKVRNDLIKNELGVSLKYPTYRDGLKALLALE